VAATSASPTARPKASQIASALVPAGSSTIGRISGAAAPVPPKRPAATPARLRVSTCAPTVPIRRPARRSSTRACRSSA
jgi:hypothetical protein